MRNGYIQRKTAETDISLKIELDGSGKSKINTGCGFMDHMLTLFAAHGGFDLEVECRGDVQVDYHHSIEDIGICLGKAFDQALGERRGINRYGSMLLPMDEALVMCALDISGRSFLVYDLQIPTEKVGDFDTELVEEFLIAFTRQAGITLHIKKLSGANSHHIIEGAFKSVARSLSAATEVNAKFANDIPSTKGVI